uniref:Uncharacterized protein n=1 Tax=uncultured prokaryote TaxID=198431 RepID=A0A0H5QCA7_9ZZZZ|nr:hypothetical protein [uncultured prokaryote]
MNKIINFLKNKWLLILGAAGIGAVALKKSKILYFGLIALIFVVKKKGTRLLGSKNANLVALVLTGYLAYCFIMDLAGKTSFFSDKVTNFFNSIYTKTKSIFVRN